MYTSTKAGFGNFGETPHGKVSRNDKMGVREWRRLKRIPLGSVEHGVIRSCLEQLTAQFHCHRFRLLARDTSQQSVTPEEVQGAKRTQTKHLHWNQALRKWQQRLLRDPYLRQVRRTQHGSFQEDGWRMPGQEGGHWQSEWFRCCILFLFSDRARRWIYTPSLFLLLHLRPCLRPSWGILVVETLYVVTVGDRITDTRSECVRSFWNAIKWL